MKRRGVGREVGLGGEDVSELVGCEGVVDSIGIVDSTDSMDGFTGGVNDDSIDTFGDLTDSTDAIDATSFTTTGEFTCEFGVDRTIGESPTDNSESLNTML